MRCTRNLIGGTAKRLAEKGVSSFDTSRLPRLPEQSSSAAGILDGVNEDLWKQDLCINSYRERSDG